MRPKYKTKKFTKKPYRRSDKRKSIILKIKPNADPQLKKVFASIGVPEKTPFKPDPFQLDALAAIHRTDCLVTAPTGAGKTWIAEEAIKGIWGKGGKSWYASPLKALTNSKHAEFGRRFGAENVGILTGDRKENTDAPIIVGTTEILRNQLYDAMHRGESLAVDLVILDEAHFLGDPDRGVVWEEIMIYLPSRIPLLLLSATIGNAPEIADWLSSIRTCNCAVIHESKRSVPLVPLFFHPSGKLFPILASVHPKGIKSRLSKKVADYATSDRPPLLAPPHLLPPVGAILRVLKKYHLLPAIFFLKSRADCDKALERCSKNLLPDSTQRSRLSQRIAELSSRSHRVAKHRQLWQLENLAVGSHHSGQLPIWKMVIEQLMTEGLIDAVFATSTVAAGVNFPARTVAFLNSDRFNGKEFLPMTSTQFHQMTGRAGRRGMDHIGFAMAIPGKFMDIRLIAKLITSNPSEVMSQVKINFSMVLNLLLSHTPDQIENLLKKSFAAFQFNRRTKNTESKKQNKHAGRRLSNDFQRHLKFLTLSGFVTEQGQLTDDGVWASNLRVDQPLMIAQGFRQHLFSNLEPDLLAAVISIFVYDGDLEDKPDQTSIHKKLSMAFQQTTRQLHPFAKQMAGHGFETRPFLFMPAHTLFMWATGQSWEQVLEQTSMAEGDLAMLIFRTVDNLRHVVGLKDVFPESAETAKVAISLLLRDPVVFDDLPLA